MTGIIPWLHPALGLVAVAVMMRAASLGLRARTRRAAAPAARARHRTVAPTALGLVVANVVLGLATVWGVRPDLTPAASAHAKVGTAIGLLLGVGALLSRRIPSDPRARRWHPWLGATALVLAGVQVFLGLQLVRW